MADAEQHDSGSLLLSPDNGDGARWAGGDGGIGGRLLTRQEFLASFQFSQGSTLIQHNLFAWCKLLHPDLSLAATTPSEIEELTQAWLGPASALVDNPARHTHVESGTKQPAVQGMLREAQHLLNHPLSKQHTEEYLVADLAQQILGRDDHFLRQPNGRDYTPDTPSPSASTDSSASVEHYNPYKDSWRSDVCYFGLLDKTTGLPDFDRLFAAIGTYWRVHWNDQGTPTEARDAFRDVVLTYNDRHSQQPELQVELAGLTTVEQG